ncbi:hypothetical protein INT47_009545 [Mucor saturninus]|uniref:Uncharacterized protein n=1 Tax=Mucor saturninus TaxID=64648 RepID=A0A8H7V2Z6_9FUNG|nr:hypothetical protein INT47_009545 [Mucor saturninus]
MEDLAKKLKRLVVRDFLDSTIEEHRECNDDEGFVSSTGDENHLADNFFDGDSYIQKVFLGLYGGDGINRTAYNIIGFSFRSIEFAFLYKFLVRCGVKAPNLGFYVNSSREPDRFRAGYHAAVKWEYTSEGIANIRFNYGFPSSRLYKSDSQKMNAFLCKEGDKIFIIAFFLGWFMADGTIKWNWSGNIQARRIKPQSGNKVILEVIQLLLGQAIPMNGKLLWWNEFLTSKDGLLAEETAPPRSKSFFEYLGQNAILHHPLACLIGQ